MKKADSVLGTPIELFTRKMFTHIIQKLSAFLAQGDFTISELAALHIVEHSEGLSVQSLAHKLNLSISATSRLVSGLVKKGLFLRREDSKDARSKIITCSAAGVKLLNELSTERVAAIFEVAETLPASIPKLILSAISKYKK